MCIFLLALGRFFWQDTLRVMVLPAAKCPVHLFSTVIVCIRKSRMKLALCMLACICRAGSVQLSLWKTNGEREKESFLFISPSWNPTFISLKRNKCDRTTAFRKSFLKKGGISKRFPLPCLLPCMTAWGLYGLLRDCPLPPSLPSSPCLLSLLPSRSQWHSSMLTVCTVKHSGIYCQLEFPWWGVIILCLSHPLRW